MEFTLHSAEIDAPIESVYDMCANVLKWPEYFPPCKKVRIISEDGMVQLIEITAQSNETEFTWQSERVLHPDSYRIDFEQYKPSPLLKCMQGSWRMLGLSKGTLLVLEHRFETKEKVEGIVDTVHSEKEAIAFMHRTIENNSKKELNSIKKVLESDHLGATEAVFSSEIEIQATAKQIYGLLYEVQNWPQVLPHCKQINVIYEDGRNQEFEMTVVGVQGKLEVMRSVRHGYNNRSIEYFQPSLPPALQRHEGKWTITETGNGTRLESWHRIALSPEGVRSLWGGIELEKALALVEQAIEKNSMTTMQTLKAYLEKDELRAGAKGAGK